MPWALVLKMYNYLCKNVFFYLNENEFASETNFYKKWLQSKTVSHWGKEKLGNGLSRNAKNKMPVGEKWEVQVGMVKVYVRIIKKVN